MALITGGIEMTDEVVVERIRVTHPVGGESRTIQSDALATDVNSIMSKYVQTGQVPAGSVRPTYGDFTASVDFHTAMSRVKAAQGEFLRAPLAVRKHCGNDVGRFLDMVFDPERRGELEELGLVEAQAPEAAPEAAPVVEEPSS